MFNNHETRETSHGALETCIKHQGSKNGKLIHQFTNSPINSQNPPLHLSRELYKSNLFMQNKANSPGVQDDTTSYSTTTYKNFVLKSTPKNKAKQSQFKPNFRPKLALFSPKLALNSLKSFVNRLKIWYNIYRIWNQPVRSERKRGK